MRLIRRTRRYPGGLAEGCVATIGTFDGVHLGHQRILGHVADVARRRDLPSLVFSFEPTPREYFSSTSPPARLTRFREKFDALDDLGIDWLFCPPFDAAMEAMQPDDFIEQLLVGILRIRHLVVGDDFRFARKRQGTVHTLLNAGSRLGFGVEQVASVMTDGMRVSSTAIRDCLGAGDMDGARRLLGRYYRMTGRVVGGKQLGKRLGYPTANVNLHRKACPVDGIFAVRVSGLGDAPLDGVASVGTRPTVEGVEPLLEVHIFEFDRDIYGEYISVDFVARLRDEIRFPNLDRLCEQMDRDAAQARKLLSSLAANDDASS
jgi:riboflavin kinase/FMN adenylyltransferase